MEEKQYTVQDMEALAERVRKKREDVAAKKKIYSEECAALDALEREVLAALKSIGKTSYKSEKGTLIKVQKWRVSLPKTPEAWDAFFEHLKSRGEFDNLVTVNSNELNSYYMEEWDNAKKSPDPMDALNFSIPGIDEPKVHETISFRS